MSADVNIAITRINDCMGVLTGSFQLQILSCRYGGYFVAFLAASEEAAYNTADQFSSGDDDYTITENYFTMNDWYPMATGPNFQEALDSLALRIGSISEENYSTWKKLVDLSSRFFSTIVSEKKLRENHKKTLPNFNEYVALMKEEGFL